MSFTNIKRVIFSVAVLALFVNFFPLPASAVVLEINKYQVATGATASDIVASSTDAYLVYEKAGSIYFQKNRGFSELIGSGSNPVISLDINGAPYVAYNTSDGKIMYAERTSGSWSAPVEIAIGASPDLAIDTGNKVHLAFTTAGVEGLTDISYSTNKTGSFTTTIIAQATTTGEFATTTYSSPNIALSDDNYRISYVRYIENDNGYYMSISWGGLSTTTIDKLFYKPVIGKTFFTIDSSSRAQMAYISDSDTYYANTAGDVSFPNASVDSDNNEIISIKEILSTHQVIAAFTSGLDGRLKVTIFNNSDGLNTSINTDIDDASSDPAVASNGTDFFVTYAKGGDLYLASNKNIPDSTVSPIVTITTNPSTAIASTSFTALIDFGTSTTREYQIDGGVWIPVLDPETSTTTVVETEGSHTITASSTNEFGNTTSTSTTFTIDRTAPTLNVPGAQTFEATGPLTASSSIALVLASTSDVTDIITYAPQNFATGTNVITWTATDLAGNVATATSEVIINHNSAPIVTLNGSNPETVNVFDTYTEMGATANDLVDGNIPTVDILGTVDTSIVGSYTLTYNATDTANNIGSTTRTVNVVDTILPVITAPGTQTFEATGTTTTPALNQATATDNYTINPIITYSPHSFSLGTSTVTWTATDSSGNSTTTTSEVVIVDTTAPSVGTLIINGGATYTNSRNVTLTISGNDSSGNISEMKIWNYTTYSSSSWVPYSTSSAWVTGPTEGTKDVHVAFKDTSGNSGGTTTAYIIFDTTEPTTAEVVAIPTITNDNTPSVIVSSSETANPVFSGCSSSFGQFGPGNNNVTLDTLADGTYGACTIVLTDLAGNASSPLTLSTFTIDTLAPVISLSSDISTSTPTNQDITVTATTNEGTLDFVSHTFTANDSFTFTATDAAGNTASETVEITNIDKVAPVINLSSNFSTSTPINQSITINATTTNPADHFLTADSHTFTENNIPFDFVATDEAGNISTSTVNITNIISNDEYTQDGVKLDFDPATISGTYTLNVARDTETSFSTNGFDSVGSYYEITSDLVNGTFSTTLTFDYNDADNNGVVDGTNINENNLNVYYWASSTWNLIPNPTRDTINNKISVTVDHFTTFGVMSPVVTVTTQASGSHSSGYVMPIGKVLGEKTSKADQLKLNKLIAQLRQIKRQILLLQHPELKQVVAPVVVVKAPDTIINPILKDKATVTATSTPKKPWWKFFW